MAATGTSGPRRFFTPRRLLFLGVAAVIAIVAVLVWFQPQKLIQDTRVDEAPPPVVEGKEDDAMVEEDAKLMSAAGDFRSLDHETKGRAMLTQAEDGDHYVRFESFSTENGPDLFVYLSTAPVTAEGSEFAEDFVDLGRLKGNIGNQNYLVPEGTDIDRYKSVVIWCRRFTSPFGAAPLELR